MAGRTTTSASPRGSANAVTKAIHGGRVPIRPGSARRPSDAAGCPDLKLYNVDDDPDETNNLAGTTRERDAADLLRDVLREIDAPDDQFERLGLS